MPWKDGGGVTTELATSPEGAGINGDFAWRLSSAPVVASGPFSRFPGRLRALVLLDGPGFELHSGGRNLILDRFEAPVHFSGDDATQVTLHGGRCLDLGLIWDPRRVQAGVAAKRVGQESLRIVPACTTLLVVPRGGVRIEPGGFELGPMDTLRCGERSLPAGLLLQTTAPRTSVPVVVVRIWPSDGSLHSTLPQDQQGRPHQPAHSRGSRVSPGGRLGEARTPRNGSRPQASPTPMAPP